jgi:hypothetical protein
MHHKNVSHGGCFRGKLASQKHKSRTSQLQELVRGVLENLMDHLIANKYLTFHDRVDRGHLLLYTLTQMTAMHILFL